MGFVLALPAMAASAGGAAAATAGVSAATLATTAISTGLQVHAQRQAAGAQEVQLKLQKRQEAQAASDRELQRQRRLNALLGANNAQIAAAGVVNSGSVANVSLIDARRAAEDSQVDQINTATRISAINTNVRAIRRASNIEQAGTIFRAAERYRARG